MVDAESAAARVNVQVAVRCRPMNGKEQKEDAKLAVEFPSSNQVVLTAKGEKQPFAFDYVFSPDSVQVAVFEALGVPLLDKAFEGYNSTIFAYGQTGSGKTHTMLNHRADAENRGLVPRIGDSLYERINKLSAEHENRRFLVCASFLEIYNEIIHDLLVPKGKQSKGGLEIKEQQGIGVYVKDLTEVVVDTSEKLNGLIEQGFAHRVTATTKMNDQSSRSHCIFMIKLHQKDAADETKNTFSKVNLVDLAGSERAKSTEAEGDRLKEGANINKSLSALGNVINALSSMGSGSKKVFVPYRNSKLTRVLQESLGGNSLCTMLAAMSPSDTNVEETLSTLNYAKRAKAIKVTATKNEESSQIKKLEEEVQALRKKLESQAGAGMQVELNSRDKKEMEAKYETQIQELQVFMKQSWEDKQQLSQQYEENQKRAEEEGARAAEMVRKERRQRLQLLESNGDINLSLRSLVSLGSKLVGVWPEKIHEAMKVEQQMRSQVRAVRVYRDSAAHDFANWGTRSAGHADTIAVLTIVSQAHSKLGSMLKELQKLSRLEAQLDEQFALIGPEVALALREAQQTPDEEVREELVEHLALVQRQLSTQHEKAQEFVLSERQQLAFAEELAKLAEALEQEQASGEEPLADETLLLALKSAADGAKCGSQPNTGVQKREAPRALGISTFDIEDSRLSASSNVLAARHGRLCQVIGFGGWCPLNDSASEYFEVDFGKELQVLAVNIQGRTPLTCEWQQTRDLLELAVDGEPLPSSDRLPTQEKFFKRPPVRLIHDIGVWYSNRGGWDVAQNLTSYGDLSREDKMVFFEQLIIQANTAGKSLGLEGDVALAAQDILSGKNCEESNKLLQLIAYLVLRLPPSQDKFGGLLDLQPQWTTHCKLQFEANGTWADAQAAGSDGFEACSDAVSVNRMPLPQPVVASKLRVAPLKWHCHPAMRVEVQVVSKDASMAGGTVSANSFGSLEDDVSLASRGLEEVQRRIDFRHQARLKEEEARSTEVANLKDKAEQDRDLLDTRLRDALARVEELEAESRSNNDRAMEAETKLLETQVQRDQLSSEKDRLESDVQNTAEQKGSAEEEVVRLRDEGSSLNNQVEDLSSQLQVMTEERDIARQKEEENFEMLTAKDEELVDTNNGYVYLTERLQEKEEEMEEQDRQIQLLKDINDKFGDRTQELQEELLQLQGERQQLKHKLGETERAHQSAEERYMRLLKDGIGAPVSGSTSRPISAKPAAAHSPGQASPQDTYEDDFDEDEQN